MAAHTALARQLGVTEELLDALYHIDTHRHLFTARELAALRFAEIMTTSGRDVDEALWDVLQAHFDDGEIVEDGNHNDLMKKEGLYHKFLTTYIDY